MDEPLTPKRPYLLRAMHEWMTENGQTPHIIVDASVDGVVVPEQHVQQGKIVLNVGYSATNGLQLGNEEISFGARFGGAAVSIRVPVEAVLGIYARESGQGMIFSEQELGPQSEVGEREDKDVKPDRSEVGKPDLRIIK